MEAVFNLNNSASWQLRKTVSKTASNLKEDSGILPFLVGSSFQSRYLAVGITVSNSKNTWRDGGYITQALSFPSANYRQANKSLFRSQNLLVNNVTIVEVLPVTSSYSIYYFPLGYFERVRIQVWEYTGQAEEVNNNSGSISSDDLTLITESISTELASSQISTEDLEKLSNDERLEILAQLSQIDAGIYTLAEGIANLLPASQGEQLRQKTQNKLDLDLGFL